MQLARKACPHKLCRVHTVKPVGSPFSSPLGLQLTLRLLTSPTDHLSAHLAAVQPSTLGAYPCKLYRVHTVKPVGSPFSSPLGLQLTLRLLTSPADHLSAHLAAVQPSTLALQLARKAYPCEIYSMHTVKPVGSPFSSPLGMQLQTADKPRISPFGSPCGCEP